MKSLFSIFLFILFLNPVVFACSMAQAPPLPFSKPFSSYIFVGEIVGYTEIVSDAAKFYGEGRGVKIKPVEAINLPKPPTGDYYEFFKFGVYPDCQPAITDLSRLPIGTKLRLITGEAKFLSNRSAENRIRLESQLFDRFSVITDGDGFTTDADSVFDYKSWKSLQKQILDSNVYERQSAFVDFMFVEVNKDLLRLEKTKSKTERYAILERLVYAPYIDYPGIINPALSSNYSYSLQLMKPGRVSTAKKVKLTSTEKQLLKKRGEIEKENFYNRF